MVLAILYIIVSKYIPNSSFLNWYLLKICFYPLVQTSNVVYIRLNNIRGMCRILGHSTSCELFGTCTTLYTIPQINHQTLQMRIYCICSVENCLYYIQNGEMLKWKQIPLLVVPKLFLNELVNKCTAVTIYSTSVYTVNGLIVYRYITLHIRCSTGIFEAIASWPITVSRCSRYFS